MTVNGFPYLIISKAERKKVPKYTAILSKKAQKQLDKLSDKIANPILQAIEDLENDPRPFGYKKLV